MKISNRKSSAFNLPKILSILLFLSPSVLAATDGDLSSIGTQRENGRFTAVLLNYGVKLESSAEVKNWLNKYARNWWKLSSDDEIQLSPPATFNRNYKSYRIKQSHKGIPVIGLDSILILDNSNEPVFMQGMHSSMENKPTRPSISQAIALASSGLKKQDVSDIKLVYSLDKNDKAKLAYQVTVSNPVSEEQDAEIVYIDAINSEVIKRTPMMHSVLKRIIYDLSPSCAALGNGRITAGKLNHAQNNHHTRREGQAKSKSTSVNTLYDILGHANDYMLNILEMESLDDQGMPIKAATNVFYPPGKPAPHCSGGDTFQATWVSSWNMLFIPTIALPYIEVIGHELAHGIVSNGSNLAYENESGALNEAIADIIGVGFRAWYKSGGKTNPNLSKIKNNLDVWELRTNEGPSRSLKKPSQHNQPDHYLDFFHTPADKDHDWGGVHTNSGIINQAFYLVAMGGQHPHRGSGPNIIGIGIAKSARIAAISARYTLNQYDQFQDARSAFAATASFLYGEGSTEWLSVHQAMDAVGIPGQWSLPKPKPDPIKNKVDTSKVDQPTQKKEQTKTPTKKTEPAKPEKRSNLRYALISLLFLSMIFAVWVILRVTRKLNPKTTVQDYHLNKTTSTANPEPLNKVQASPSIPLPPYTFEALDGSESIVIQEKWIGSQEGLVIGRAMELVHVHMESRLVSRRHLRITGNSQQLYVEDLNSSHGTSIDGSPLKPFKPQQIQPNQLLRIAGFSYRLTLNRSS